MLQGSFWVCACLNPNKQLTSALRSGVRCWPIRVCARSVTRDRVRAVECEAVVTTKCCLTTVVVAIAFGHGATRGCVGVRARALGAGAGTAECGTIPGDRASVSGVARACEARSVVGILNVTWRRCREYTCFNTCVKTTMLRNVQSYNQVKLTVPPRSNDKATVIYGAQCE